jgi:diguanylate cyclase (GGDEF)-like protein/PAS domain S-box-containing protein
VAKCEDGLGRSEGGRYGRLLEEAQRLAHLGSWEWDLSTNDVVWSDELYRILGFEVHDVSPSYGIFLDRVHPADRAQVVEDIRRALQGERLDRTFRVVKVDETLTWVHCRGETVETPEGPKLVGTALDVSERLFVEERLAASEARFRALADNAPDFIFRYRVRPSPGFDYVSPASAALTGYTPGELYGDPGLIRLMVEDAFDQALARLSHSPEFGEARDLSVKRKDGSAIWVELRLRADIGHTGHVVAVEGIARDITDRKSTEARMVHLALHDALTGLPNRTLLLDRLEHAMARSPRGRGSRHGRRKQTGVAVLYVDLDGFKEVNDSYGHLVGDTVLRQVGARLTSSIRPSDTLARIGGDEFLVVCEEVSGSEAAALAERLITALEGAFSVVGGEVLVTASVGIKLAATAEEPYDVLADADAAMYRAKRERRGGVVEFDDSMRRPNRPRHDWSAWRHDLSAT